MAVHVGVVFGQEAEGNLTNDGRWSYVWDAENRLIQMTVNTNVGPQYQLTFAYDPQGRRIEKIVLIGGVPQSTNLFLYDGWNVIAVLNSSSQLQSSYVWGNDLSGSQQGAGGVGGLVEVSYHGSPTTNCFVAYDGNGNVAALVYTNGLMAAEYEYDPYGNLVSMSGPLASANKYRFSSKEWDSQAGLYYYLYRFYDPNLQRWPNRDPITEVGWNILTHHLPPKLAIFKYGDKNPYEFSMNEGVDRYDPLGLDSVTFWILGCLKSPAGKKDPAACFCIIAPDEKECKDKMGGCIAADAKCIPDPTTGKPGKPSAKDICNCGCDILGQSNDITPSALKDCHEKCNKLK